MSKSDDQPTHSTDNQGSGDEDGRDQAEGSDLVSFLPPRVYYFSHDGQDLWCRRPYGFFFSSQEQAERFLSQLGSTFELSLMALDRGALMDPGFLDGLRRLQVNRLFLDPEIDPVSGDVFGRILRLASTGASA